VVVLSLSCLSLEARASRPAPDEPLVHDVPVKSLFPTKLPFAAWSVKAAAHIKKEAKGSALDIGWIRHGDWVVVNGCLPSCEDPKGWALLDPFGAVRLSDLSTGPQEHDGALAQATFQRFVYGTVLPKRMRVYAEPRENSQVIKTHPKKHVLAFRDDDFAIDGWLQRPGKGWVKRDDVRLASPSDLRGFENPGYAAFALFLREVNGVPRYALRPVFDVIERGKKVLVPEGAVPRDAVRLGFTRAVPRSIPPNQRWVHVDLKEQVLTAYEGEKLVFTTLVSTGRRGHATGVGTFRVQQKVAHTAMDSERERYFVDEVPFIQYFNSSQGFHGAFWHDRFGNVMSHGCVNLSIEDASWLFQWSNPRLPEGWQTVIAHNANLASAWVKIERKAAIQGFVPTPEPQILTSASEPE
jgi:L,D-transpeptidase catalytic domain